MEAVVVTALSITRQQKSLGYAVQTSALGTKHFVATGFNPLLQNQFK